MSYRWVDINTVEMLLKCLHLPTHMLQDLTSVTQRYMHATPNVQQALLLFVNVMYRQLIKLLMENTLYLVVNQTEVCSFKTCLHKTVRYLKKYLTGTINFSKLISK